jgi:hypothetical protein
VWVVLAAQVIVALFAAVVLLWFDVRATTAGW